MWRITYTIPLRISGLCPDGIPIYGFGLMLFLAFVLGTWLAGRRAVKMGIAKERIQDLAIWMFVGGIIGSRLTFFLVEDKTITLTNFFTWDTLKRFLSIWDGGLVLYGSIVGGAAGLAIAYFTFLRKYGVTFWKLADIFAPSLALGVCLGRIGCLLNGCCYGGVACPECVAVSYPLSADVRFDYTKRGLQTAAGFTLKEKPSFAVVDVVEKASAAEAAGLLPDDIILEANGKDILDKTDLDQALTTQWPRQKNDLTLTVVHPGKKEPTAVGPFSPRSISLFPTQIHESISTFLIFLLLLAFEPFKPREGSLMVLFLFLYSIHRFIDEMLRNDTDRYDFLTFSRCNDSETYSCLTFSQYVSVAVIAGAIGLGVWMWKRLPAVKPTDPQSA
jgi:phosphatidylglycerol:prolipoprotein diacylglycerol transferase